MQTKPSETHPILYISAYVIFTVPMWPDEDGRHKGPMVTDRRRQPVAILGCVPSQSQLNWGYALWYIEHVARNMAKTARMGSCIMIRNICGERYGVSLFSVL